VTFGNKLEQACLDTLADGIMTGDLAGLADPGTCRKKASSEEFLDEIAARLKKSLS